MGLALLITGLFFLIMDRHELDLGVGIVLLVIGSFIMDLALGGTLFIILGIFLWVSFDWNDWWGVGTIVLGILLLMFG